MDTEEKDYSNNNNLPATIRFIKFVVDLIDKPIIWFRETIVEPNRPEYYWYHEKIRRVPTIDECYEGDTLCYYEAEMQYRLDQKVDNQILDILRRRFERCLMDHPNDRSDCDKMGRVYEDSMTNFFIKYGDLGLQNKAFTCYMKQKHRMAWERRHGPVGSGKKPEEEVYKKKETTC